MGRHDGNTQPKKKQKSRRQGSGAAPSPAHGQPDRQTRVAKKGSSR